MAEITWTCHICGDERPDSLISVYQTRAPMPGRPDYPVTQNVRFCNDRPQCRDGATRFSFFTKPGDTMSVGAGDRSAAQLALRTGPDAINRAVRTFIQVALVEIVVVVVPLLLTVLDSGLTWVEALRSVIRAILAAILAWGMRKRFPPPAPTS